MTIKKILLALGICSLLNKGFAQTVNSFDSLAEGDTQIEDSVLQKREVEFLLPINIYKNLANGVNKQKLYKDLNLRLLAHRGGIDFFQIGGTFTGLHFVGQNLTEISFRYFGEDGINFETSMVKAGFLLKKVAKSSNLEIYSDFETQMLDGEIRIYKRGNIVCRVYDGSYIGFTFCKSPSAK
jgi:hypothetical protein